MTGKGPMTLPGILAHIEGLPSPVSTRDLFLIEMAARQRRVQMESAMARQPSVQHMLELVRETWNNG